MLPIPFRGILLRTCGKRRRRRLGKAAGPYYYRQPGFRYAQSCVESRFCNATNALFRDAAADQQPHSARCLEMEGGVGFRSRRRACTDDAIPR